MAVFVSASDESSGATLDSMFYYGGFVGPVRDWMDTFAPMWEKRVLYGPPQIPYFHMTEIRSKSFKEKYGLEKGEDEYRIDQAISVLEAMPSLAAIGSRVHARKLRDTFQKKLKVGSGAVKKFMPDYIGFLGYATVILNYVSQLHPEAEKVDFVVERNGEITNHITEFYDTMPPILNEIGRSDLVPLLGDLIPGSKARVPLQAADVCLWFSRRSQEETLNERDMKRLVKLKSGRDGWLHTWSDKHIESIYERAVNRASEEAIRISELQQDHDQAFEGSAQRDQEGTGRREGSKETTP